jgi:Fe-S-cluster containining protein
MNGSGANLAGCSTCAGNCCRHYRVGVNARDVRNLAAGTMLHPAEFIRLMEVERKNREGFRLQPGGAEMDLYLIRAAKTGACVFLMEIAPGKARCGVYAHRPLVCSNFPTALTRGAVDIRQDTVCGPNAWNLSAMDLPTYRRDLTRDQTAWAEHRQLVKAWNAQVDTGGRERTDKDLYDYLLEYPAEVE